MKTMKASKIRRARPVVRKAPAARPPAKNLLRLFVAGATVRSRQAILRVRELCAAEPKGLYELEVVDIYQQPDLARVNQIVATPTLIIAFPPPLRRLIGNLADISGLCVELDLVKKVKIAL
jgi:circadian clock protein KaiB